MPAGPSSVVFKDLHALFRLGTLSGLTDRQLLEEFLSRRDEAGEAAFRALVEKHAPMVLRICRDVLADWHDAEDASQATFIVLAHKARSIRQRDSIASWLFGVAHRVAAQSRAKSARRRKHEKRHARQTAAEIASDEPCIDWRELYDEIDRLPERLREPVVLCDLQGYSQAEAAQRVGCPLRTLQNRLARARMRMRGRLAGPALFAAGGLWQASIGSGGASAQVSAAWLDTAVRAALESVNRTGAAGAISASAATLAEALLRVMFRTRLKSVVGAAVSTTALAIGIVSLAVRTAGAPAHKPSAAEAAQAAPAAPSDNALARAGNPRGAEIIARAFDLARDGEDGGLSGMVAIDPQKGVWRSIWKGGLSIGPGPVSPDGRFIVYSSLGPDPDPDQLGIWVYDLTGETPPRRILERKGQPFWTKHGRELVISVLIGPPLKFETWRVNFDGTGAVKLPIPDTKHVLDCSADGTWLVTRTMTGRGEAALPERLNLIHPDGTGVRTLTQGSAKDALISAPRISPDGLSIAYVEMQGENGVQQSRLFVADIEGKRRREVPIPLDPGTIRAICWSPDGSRLALNPIDIRQKTGSIAVVDLDGSNFRTLPLPPGRWNIQVCDWSTLTAALRVGSPNQALDPKSPRGRYEALVEECKKASQAFLQQHREAKTADERTRISKENSRRDRRDLGRFLEIAESAPNDPAAVDALLWVVQYGFHGPEFDRAVDLLVQHHIARRKVGLAVSSGSASPSAEKLLRAVVEKGTDDTIKGMACLALGRYFKHQSERAVGIRDNVESAKRWEAMLLEDGVDKEGVARFMAFLGRGPDALMRQAEAAFERAIKQFGDTSRRGDALKTDAQAELYEIRELHPGKPAPEITGKDRDGKPLTLSQFQGKVVVVDFWTTTCGACRDMNAFERSLVKRMEGKPFVLLGVNCDGDEGKLNDWIKKEGITWRTWRDGSDGNAEGPIFRQFSIYTWPTIYVIDHRGIIRDRFLGFPGAGRLDAAIQTLVREAEKVGGPATKN
jgi:RNA polymerase sigma factor (sigma-70 family)